MLLSALLLILAQPLVDNDVVFAKVAGQDLKMDIHYPVGEIAGLSPAVIVIHGGAWMAGERKDIEWLAKAVAAQGILAANVQYRLAPKFKYPAMLDDVQTAVRYLRENADRLKIDPKRIGASGASAGGHLSLLLGFVDTRDKKPADFPSHSSRVGAVLDLFGPTDFARDYPASADMLFSIVLGKPKAQAAVEIKEASPVTYVSRSSCPVFIVQGMADAIVPPAQSKRLEELLRASRVPVESVYIDGLGHGPDGKSESLTKQFMDSIAKGIGFLKKTLGK